MKWVLFIIEWDKFRGSWSLCYLAMVYPKFFPVGISPVQNFFLWLFPRGIRKDKCHPSPLPQEIQNKNTLKNNIYQFLYILTKFYFFILLTCTANQLTGFYMRATLAFNGLSKERLLNKAASAIFWMRKTLKISGKDLKSQRQIWDILQGVSSLEV